MSTSPGRITLWNIEVFVACAEEASISLAAKRLDASAATVSQQITSLEAALGTTLLDRSARPVVLTPAGDVFLRRANAILNEAEQARAELTRSDLSRLMRLRLGMIEDFDADLTPHLLQGLSTALRSCQFLLETGASHRLFDLLEARSLDAVVASDMGEPAPWMDVHPLLEEPFVAVVPKGRIGAGDVAAQLQDMLFVQYTRRHHMGRMLADHLEREGVRLDSRFELDSYHAIMAMVAAGQGWSILTPLGWLRAQRFRDDVDLVALPFKPLSRRISLVARSGTLGDIPSDMAAQLRVALQSLIVGPATARAQWLAPIMSVL